MFTELVSSRSTRSAALLLAISTGFSGAACSTTTSTTSIQVSPEKPIHRLRLVRPEVPSIVATWRQDGRSIRGQLSLGAACQSETIRTSRRAEVTETKPNPAFSTTGYVIGGLLSAGGLAALVASKDADDRVTCGSGGQVREGDECISVQGALVGLGLSLLGSGIGAVMASVIVAGRATETEIKPLAPERAVSVTPGTRACGELRQLDGSEIVADLGDGGKWSGAVDAQGVVAIELGSALVLREHMLAQLSIASVAPAAAQFAKPGVSLGELELAPVAAPPSR